MVTRRNFVFFSDRFWLGSLHFFGPGGFRQEVAGGDRSTRGSQRHSDSRKSGLFLSLSLALPNVITGEPLSHSASTHTLVMRDSLIIIQFQVLFLDSLRLPKNVLMEH